jgi:periplasmic protein CpxP/Spy
MKSMYLKIFAGAAVLVLAVAGLAQGMHGGRGGPMGHGMFGEHMLAFLTDKLDLSTTQQEQAKAIMEKNKPALKAAMQQMGQFHTQMRTLEEATPFDEAKVRALATQQSQAMTEMIVQKARAKNEFLQILTPDQKSKLADIEAQHEQRMWNHKPHADDSESN